jgi:hypothetical protein
MSNLIAIGVLLSGCDVSPILVSLCNRLSVCSSKRTQLWRRSALNPRKCALHLKPLQCNHISTMYILLVHGAVHHGDGGGGKIC